MAKIHDRENAGKAMPPAPPGTAVVAVRFDGSSGSYDYFTRIGVKVGDRVVVDTKRGEATVTVMEIRQHSDRAEKFILRKADDPKPRNGDPF